MFDLQGNIVNKLTVDLRGLEPGEAIILDDGTVENLRVVDQSGVLLDVRNVTVINEMFIK